MSENINAETISVVEQQRRDKFLQMAKEGTVEAAKEFLHSHAFTEDHCNFHDHVSDPARNTISYLAIPYALHGNTPVLTYLVDTYPSLLDYDANLKEILMNAIDIQPKGEAAGVEIWRVVLQRKPKLVNVEFGLLECSALEWAAKYNNTALVELLLAKGADVYDWYAKCSILDTLRHVDLEDEMLALLNGYLERCRLPHSNVICHSAVGPGPEGWVVRPFPLGT